jgi:hypothetical protein
MGAVLPKLPNGPDHFPPRFSAFRRFVSAASELPCAPIGLDRPGLPIATGGVSGSPAR